MTLFGKKGRVEAEINRVNAYKKTFNSPEGQKVMLDLADKSGFFADLVVPNDALSTAFNNGRRSLFLEILKAAGSDLNGLLKTANEMAEMMREKEKENGN